jgi:nitrogen regulatory protein PII
MLNPCLIVSIVRRGWGDAVLEATMKAGAQGGTVLFGRGVGRNEQEKVFGIQIQPEKEVVLTVVPAALKDAVLDAAYRAAELNMKGHGIAFVVPVTALVGLAHEAAKKEAEG